MKALTLTQPWATLIAIGAKQIETRSWGTKYRGPIAIHAAKGFPRSALEICITHPFVDALAKAYILHPAELPRACVIATCELVDVIKITPMLTDLPTQPERSFGDYSVGRYMWKLENVERFSVPIEAKGALSLWEWSGS